MTQENLIKDFFIKNPNRDIKHPEVVDAVEVAYKEKTGKKFRDPDRAIRKLHQQGFLIKVGKGIYRYDPEQATKKELKEFTTAQKTIILERDKYCCARCGRGKKEGVELHIDHIKAKDVGGDNTIENGQVLCSRCNFIKKNTGHTESGKKMFIRLYELAKKENNEELKNFTNELLNTFEKYNINGHIEWEK